MIEQAVFFSYSRKDAFVAKVLRQQLLADRRSKIEVRGIADESDQGSPLFDRTTLRGAIAAASIVVVLLSLHSLNSHWVQFELGVAWGMGKRVLLLPIGENLPRELPEPFQGLTSLEWHDLFGPRMPDWKKSWSPHFFPPEEI